MISRRILTLICAAFVLTEARWHQKRETKSVCDQAYNSPDSQQVLCYCIKDIRQPELIRSADCYLAVEGVKSTDHAWDAFDYLKTATKMTLTNARGVSLPYIPTHGLKHIESLAVLDVKYGNIKKIHPYAFANLSSLEEINIRDSQVKTLEPHSFAHLKDLTEIKLDKNNIVEINRDVFMDLPSLERLFLTSNQITTIHDRAFVHLNGLRELEINMNKLFSLNSETFSGLNRLQKLDLSSNSLEVIGDNTFLPLKNLQTLNLEANKIQMLDEKAFNGLGKLLYLSLAHNKLADIENEKTFMGLESLKTLNLRANDIRELKKGVVAPLLQNFYKSDGHLDVEENIFPCDCRLEWFTTLMNRTRSKNLKMSLENLKCLPDTKLRDAWNNLEEVEKNSGQTLEVDDNQSGAEYEYYDESQLDGKLFYIDLRDLINCDGRAPKKVEATSPKTVTRGPILVTAAPTIAHPPVVSTATKEPVRATTNKLNVPKTNIPRIEIPNHGTLDLSVDETTPKEIKEVENAIEEEKRPDAYTTTRFVTVSANPIEKHNVYDNMASDEAQPDKLKAQRSVQDDYKQLSSGGHRITGCASLILLILLRLHN